MPWIDPNKEEELDALTKSVTVKAPVRPKVGKDVKPPGVSDGRITAGLEFEKRFLKLLRASTSLAWKVGDTRLLGKDPDTQRKTRFIAPKVHSDFEAIIVGRNKMELAKSKHIYVEAKSSKKFPSFPMYDTVLQTKKEHQWRWVEMIDGVQHEDAFYAIENHVNPGSWYVFLLSWDELSYWISWMEENSKKSVLWEKIRQHLPNHCVLLQTEGDTSNNRYVNLPNIEKLQRFMGVASWDIIELEYPWS